MAAKLSGAPAKERSAIARAAHAANPYGRDKGKWNGEAFEHEEQYGHLKEKVLHPLTQSTAEELFLKLVREKASDEKVRKESW